MTKNTTTSESTTPTTTKRGRAKAATPPPELARLDLPVQQRGLEAYAANPDDVIGRAADSPATVVRIPLVAVVESSENARRSFDQSELEGLAQSLRAVGLREPVELKPRGKRDDGAPGAYELVDGARRFRAAKLLGWTDIPAWIHDEQDLVVATVRAVRNHQRVNLTPYEEALDFKNILDKGATVDQVAALTGRSVDLVERRLKLLELPPDLARRVGEEGFTHLHAEVLVAVAKKQPELLDHAKPLIGKRDYRGAPLAAKDFASEMAESIRKEGKAIDPVRDYQVSYEFDAHPSFKKRRDALDHVKVGDTRLITDVEGYKALASELRSHVEEKRRKANEERSAANAATNARFEIEREVDRRVRDARREAELALIQKTVKGLLDFGARELLTVAQHAAQDYLEDEPMGEAEVKMLAEATNIPLSTLKPIFAPEDDSKALQATPKLAEKLWADLEKPRNRRTLARLALGLLMLDSRGTQYWSRTPWGLVMKRYWKKSPDQLEAQLKPKIQKEVREERKAKKKAQKKATAKKPAKTAAKPDVEDVGDQDFDEDLDDGEVMDE